MASHTQTDNAFFNAKLNLRRYFLRTYYGTGQFSVFDGCRGSGRIWETLRKEHPCHYWGVDVKPSPGRMKINSARVLAQPGWDFDVIDIDTYGSPWKHWVALLPHVRKPIVVFLTIGQLRIGGGAVDKEAVKAIGLDALPSLPGTIKTAVVQRIGLPAMLALARHHNLLLSDCREMTTASVTARYVGARLSPSGVTTQPSDY